MQATDRGGRSTVLYPLGWALAIGVTGLVACVRYKAPSWLLVSVVSGTGLLLAAYLVAYGYFMIKDPSALRSERYLLSKLRIEQSTIGDTSHGFTAVETQQARPGLLPPAQDEDDR
jgi:hypothetical protein